MAQARDFSDQTAGAVRRPRRRGAKPPGMRPGMLAGMTAAATRPHPAIGRQPPRFSGRNAYSLFVGILKVVLPAFAAALVLLVVVWPQLIPDTNRFRIGVSQISLEQAENLSMMNARYDGLDQKNRPFSVTADLATQETANADIVDLERPKADITLEDGTWLAIAAKTGRYRREAEIVELDGDVVLYHDKGFEVRTDAATIFLKQGDARGSTPVSGQGPAGQLTAEGFHLIDQGARIIFTGKSQMVLYPKAEERLP